MERRDLRHDQHTVSLLADHMVFSPKYRGKILVDDVALVVEGIIRKTCKEMNIEVIDMAVNVDHVHLFIKYLSKVFCKFHRKEDQGKNKQSTREQHFPHLREWCTDHLWAPSCYHGSVGHGWEVVEKYIGTQNYVQKRKTRLHWLCT